MGIFRRHGQGDTPQTSAAADAVAQGRHSEQTAALMPPFVSARGGAAAAPGVVPPPAAPIYSMRPPEAAARAEGSPESLLAEQVKMAKEALQSIQETTVQVAVQRKKTTADRVNGGPKRPSRRARPVIPSVRPQDLPSFDPVRCTQAGLLKLAWSWQESGAPIRAINAYVQVLSRYPDTPAAAAAVADLVELSDSLLEDGRFQLALGIYDQLEQLL